MSTVHSLPSKFHVINLKSKKIKSINFGNACIVLVFRIQDFLTSMLGQEAG
jgi:hypothetical protein